VYWLLQYEVVGDYLERRPNYRQEHLELAHEAAQNGQLVMAGALSDPVDGAILVFLAPDSAPAQSFAQRDPYVRAGLVTQSRVRRWHVVVGPNAEPV
jgi:uncharacterized protein YciI